MRTALYRCVPLMCGISALLILFAVPPTRLYYRDAADPVYHMTVMGFRILPLCMPLSVICMHFVCYGQTSGKQVLVHLLSVLDGVVCVAGFSALLVPRMGINGVYVANVLNGLVTTLVIVLYAWICGKRFPRDMDSLMVIPENFGAPEDARMDLTLRSVEEVVDVSRQVQDFCLRRGIDGRRSYLAGLFMEEMAGNVIEHGFTKDRKKHAVDIRVVHKDGAVILRIKDDCVPFNPQERQKIVDPRSALTTQYRDGVAIEGGVIHHAEQRRRGVRLARKRAVHRADRQEAQHRVHRIERGDLVAQAHRSILERKLREEHVIDQQVLEPALPVGTQRLEALPAVRVPDGKARAGDLAIIADAVTEAVQIAKDRLGGGKREGQIAAGLGHLHRFPTRQQR